MKTYPAMVIEEKNCKYHAYPVKLKIGENILSAIPGAKYIYPAVSYEKAEYMAKWHNQTFRNNNTYLYEEATT